MKPIKIRNRIYHPQKGDYITQTTSGYFFCTGDGRKIQIGPGIWAAHKRLTKKAVSEIEFDKLSFSTRGDRKYWFYV